MLSYSLFFVLLLHVLVTIRKSQFLILILLIEILMVPFEALIDIDLRLTLAIVQTIEFKEIDPPITYLPHH